MVDEQTKQHAIHRDMLLVWLKKAQQIFKDSVPLTLYYSIRLLKLSMKMSLSCCHPKTKIWLKTVMLACSVTFVNFKTPNDGVSFYLAGIYCCALLLAKCVYIVILLAYNS